jgi:hypothetical protein
VPFKRLERLESQLAMPLPAAVQWELMALGAKLLRPVLQELMRQAAQGSVLHNDDTGIRIVRLVRGTGDKRTGTYCRNPEAISRDAPVAAPGCNQSCGSWQASARKPQSNT